MPIIRRSLAELASYTQGVDWDKVDATTDEEIAQQIASDPDTAPDMIDLPGWRIVHNPSAPDVRQIRTDLGLSQRAFAARFGLSVRTVQEWEQGRSVPDQPARVLLKVIQSAPEIVERVLRAS